MDYAKGLTYIREQKKISQEAAAAKAGISCGYLSKLESGLKKDPSQSVLKKLCKAYGIDPFILTWFSVEPSDIPKSKKYLHEQLKTVMDSLCDEYLAIKK